jgi:uncharacterized 2Fe-2S/4Fe-4S cluster protein (DUF4445 family)
MSPVTVTFEPDGRRVRADSGDTLLKIANRGGIQIRSECNGQGKCGKCRIKIRSDYGTTSPTQSELKHLNSGLIREGFRLSCQTQILGFQPVQVLILPESRIGERRLQIQSVIKSFPLNPTIHTYLVHIPPLNFDHIIPDNERFLEGIAKTVSSKRPQQWVVPLPVLEKIPSVIRTPVMHVTVMIRDKTLVLDAVPGDALENIFGLAIDIGTSKIVAALHSLYTGELLAVEGIENPQIQFGEDIMTRLHYAAVEYKNLKNLQQTVVQAINRLIQGLIKTSGVPRQHIYETVVVGNTVMTSLFLGLDTTHLAYGPFVPPIKGPTEISTQQIDLNLPSQGLVHVLPSVAGYVGADAIADVLATRIHRYKKTSLLIDIGTNSEVILGNRSNLIACSCAAGPAFEGAHIEYGMKAVTGAIERVTINPQTLSVEVQTIDDASPIGICGSGIVDTVAQLAHSGLLNHKGRFTEKAKPLLVTKGKKRKFILVPGNKSLQLPRLTVSEEDISQLLLAKAAIQTGWQLLLEHKKIPVSDIDQVFLAGAFGRYLNPNSARILGIIPQVSLQKVQFVGNTALAGAQRALLSKTSRNEASKLARSIHHLDLARNPNFNKTYTNALFLPDMQS